MPATDSKAHAARTGAWALLVVFVCEFLVGRAHAYLHRGALADRDDWDARRDWFRWLDWTGDAQLPTQMVMVAIAVIALLRLRRAADDAVTRNMFLGAGVLWALQLVSTVIFQQASVRGDYEAWALATPWEQFLGRVQMATMLVESTVLALVLAGVWRLRRAWGRPLGAGLVAAVVVFALGLLADLGLGMALFGPGAALTFWLPLVELLGFGAALVALARGAPADPEAARAPAAASGLDLYFRAVVLRVTVLVVGVVVIQMFNLGRTTPSTLATLYFGLVALQLPTVIAAIAGLTRFLDAPLRLFRGALWPAIVAMGLGAAFECLILTALFNAARAEPNALFDERVPTRAMLVDVAVAGQALGLLASLALLLSLWRAAVSLEAPALQRRALALFVGIVSAAAVVVGIVYGGGEVVLKSRWTVVALGVFALVFGLTMFISWLRLIEGVAQRLRARSTPP